MTLKIKISLKLLEKNCSAWYMYLIINVEANFKTNYVESSTIGMGSLADRKAII